MDEPKPPENNSQSTEPNSPQPPDQNSQEPNPLASEEPKQPLPHSPQFQQQLDQFRKAAAGPEGSDKPTVVRHKKIKLVPVLLVVLVLALIGGGVYWFMNKSSKPAATKTTASTVTTPNYFTSSDKYICAPAAVTAVLCDNVDTNSITKYELPHFVGIPLTINPSPDGNKILISSYSDQVKTPNQVHYFVLDKNMKLIKELPIFAANQDSSGYNWMSDSNSFVYDLRTTGSNKQFGDYSLYTYNLAIGKTQKLVTNKNLYYPIVMKSGKIVAYGKGGTDSTGEELAEVSATDGTVTDIDATAMYKDLDKTTARIFYSPNNDLYYVSGTNTQTNKSITKVAKLVTSNGKPKLVVIATRSKETNNGFPTITTNGMLLSTGDAAAPDKLQLYDGSKLNSIILRKNDVQYTFTANKPLFTTGDSNNKLVSNDYLYEFAKPPARLHSFLANLVSQGCKAGQYKSVVMNINDGDTQAAVEQGQCGSYGLQGTAYYIYQNGTYKAVVQTQQGVTCDLQAKDGISKVVLPDCIPPGQGP